MAELWSLCELWMFLLRSCQICTLPSLLEDATNPFLYDIPHIYEVCAYILRMAGFLTLISLCTIILSLLPVNIPQGYVISIHPILSLCIWYILTLFIFSKSIKLIFPDCWATYSRGYFLLNLTQVISYSSSYPFQLWFRRLT